MRRRRRRDRHGVRRPDLADVDALLARAGAGGHRADALRHVLRHDAGAGGEGLPRGLPVRGQGLDVGGGQGGCVGDARGHGQGVAVLRGEGDGLVAAGDGVDVDEVVECGGADGRHGGALGRRAAFGH